MSNLLTNTTDLQDILEVLQNKAFKSDSNLIPENIKAGVTIFGVTGTYTGNSAAIITFYIVNDSQEGNEIIEYQAEEGMTWVEWVNSDYNINNYVVVVDSQYGHDNSIYISEENAQSHSPARLCLTSDISITIYADDIVIAGECYTFSYRDF